MNQAEAARIVMAAKCAGMQVAAQDEELLTGVWAGILRDVSYAEAGNAVIALAQSADHLDPHAIRSHVRRVRARRLEEARFDELVPNADPDDTRAFLEEKRALRDAVASGRYSPEDLARYRAGGVSITGSHVALAIESGPVDPEVVEAGKRALARVRRIVKSTQEEK